MLQERPYGDTAADICGVKRNTVNRRYNRCDSLFQYKSIQAGDGGGVKDDYPRVDARGTAQKPPARRQPHEEGA